MIAGIVIGMYVGAFIGIITVSLLVAAKDADQAYKCPHGYSDSDDCPDCRH